MLAQGPVLKKQNKHKSKHLHSDIDDSQKEKEKEATHKDVALVISSTRSCKQSKYPAEGQWLSKL